MGLRRNKNTTATPAVIHDAKLSQKIVAERVAFWEQRSREDKLISKEHGIPASTLSRGRRELRHWREVAAYQQENSQ